MVAEKEQIDIRSMDKCLRDDLIDTIDYQYRFGNKGKCLQEVITSMIPEIEEAVRAYYAFLPDSDFKLTVKDLQEAYELAMN